MKKTLISLTLTLAMLISIGSYVTAQESPSENPVEVTTVVDQELNDYRDGDVPAQSSTLDGITPPITALVMCMVEQGLTYDESDETFYWNSLYYMLSLYGQMDSRAQLTDDTLILPAEAVADYAAALFTDFNGLPQLPQSMEGFITYSDGEYFLARGDAGLATIQMDSTQVLADGSTLVSGSFVYGEGEVVCTFLAKLHSNDSMFGYAIDDVVIDY